MAFSFYQWLPDWIFNDRCPFPIDRSIFALHSALLPQESTSPKANWCCYYLFSLLSEFIIISSSNQGDNKSTLRKLKFNWRVWDRTNWFMLVSSSSQETTCVCFDLALDEKRCVFGQHPVLRLRVCWPHHQTSILGGAKQCMKEQTQEIWHTNFVHRVRPQWSGEL